MGVALASAISQCVSAGLILRALTKVQDCYALDLHAIKLDLGMTKRILLLGVPAGFQNAVLPSPTCSSRRASTPLTR